MLVLRCLATVSLTLLPASFAEAAPRNWADRYIFGAWSLRIVSPDAIDPTAR